MTSPDERRKGPSNLVISWGGFLAVVGLAVSGIATYNKLQNDISNLQLAVSYQQDTNKRLSEEIKDVRLEQREMGKEFNAKADRIIENLGGNK